MAYALFQSFFNSGIRWSPIRAMRIISLLNTSRPLNFGIHLLRSSCDQVNIVPSLVDKERQSAAEARALAADAAERLAALRCELEVSRGQTTPFSYVALISNSTFPIYWTGGNERNESHFHCPALYRIPVCCS